MVNNNNNFFNDMAKIAGNAMNNFASGGQQFEEMIKAQMEYFIEKMNLAKSDDVEFLRQMVSDLKAENEDMKKQIAELMTESCLKK